MASQAAEAVVQQLGGAQREPSMEEILASIRRIIEDSDTTRTAQETAFPAAANTSSPSMGARDIETFREELHASSEPAAVVRPATPLSAEADQVTKPDVEVESVVAADPKNAPSPRIERPLQTVTVEPAGDAGARSEWNQRPASPIAAPAPAPAPVSSSPSPASLPDTPRSSIISEVAGRQVAAAFGELSDAFAASRRRSFDEIAEEMMRPMLQDWLDNNLPTLVERLVREEIERVARGGAG